jgi:hypothetical protein
MGAYFNQPRSQKLAIKEYFINNIHYRIITLYELFPEPIPESDLHNLSLSTLQLL